MITLSNLTYYPIKACRGFDVTASLVERMGLAHDRRMMVVTPAGEFLTQREIPKLALITPTLTNDFVTLAAPDFDSLQIALQKSGANFPVNIWHSENVSAVDQGDAAAQWLSDWLGASVRLVHFADGYKRAVSRDYAINADDHTGFADGYPILIISEESLNDLNAKMDAPVPMNRFRPNVVVKGCAPFEEDTWKRIKIGGVEMALVKPCARCDVPTRDQLTGQKMGNEPTATLATFRRRGNQVMFAINAIPITLGVIRVGDEVEVLA